MKSETLVRVLHLALRLAEIAQKRRAPRAPRPATRADQVVASVAPLAEKVLDRIAPETKPAVAPSGDEQRSPRVSAFALARAAALGAVVAGSAAYLVARQQLRVRDRYRLVDAPFPEELLDVLAAPGGGPRLDYDAPGGILADPGTGSVYPVIDGIPDFIGPPASASDELERRGGWLTEWANPLAKLVLGSNHAGNAAFAAAVAAAAQDGWALSVPCGPGTYEIEMARTKPLARLLCLGHEWDTLLEARRRALEAGLTNLYFVRGEVELLPVQTGSAAGIWTAHGFDRYPKPERAMMQIARVARPGALVAGVSLVSGGPRHLEALLRLGAGRWPGRRDPVTHFALLSACGLRGLRAVRDGAFVRFTGVKA